MPTNKQQNTDKTSVGGNRPTPDFSSAISDKQLIQYSGLLIPYSGYVKYANGVVANTTLSLSAQYFPFIQISGNMKTLDSWYHVEADDTLQKIAEKTAVPVQTLEKNNNLSGNNSLHLHEWLFLGDKENNVPFFMSVTSPSSSNQEIHKKGSSAFSSATEDAGYAQSFAESVGESFVRNGKDLDYLRDFSFAYKFKEFPTRIPKGARNLAEIGGKIGKYAKPAGIALSALSIGYGMYQDKGIGDHTNEAIAGTAGGFFGGDFGLCFAGIVIYIIGGEVSIPVTILIEITLTVAGSIWGDKFVSYIYDKWTGKAKDKLLEFEAKIKPYLYKVIEEWARVSEQMKYMNID